MSLHSLKDVNQLIDPLKQYQVTFTISHMRGSKGILGMLSGGSGDKAVSSNTFELRCESFTYPGTKISTTETRIWTYKRKIASQQDKSGTWETTLIEDQNGAVLNTIQNWCDLINNPVTGLINPSTLYTSLANVDIRSADGKLAKRIYLRGLYPIEIKPININASSSDAVKVSVTWNYNWFTEEKLLGL